MDVEKAGSRGGKAKNAKLTQEQKNKMMEKVRNHRWPQNSTPSRSGTSPGSKITNNHEHI